MNCAQLLKSLEQYAVCFQLKQLKSKSRKQTARITISLIYFVVGMAQGVEVPNTATTAFCCFLQSLLSDLGNEESQSKACPPTTRTTCLGVEFDTLAMTK